MMNKHQMGEVLAMVSALDGQLVAESKVLMWLEVLQGCTYEELVAAITPAHLEAEKGVVQARDLFEQVRRARAVANQVPELGMDFPSSPQPICEHHDLPVTVCVDCCGLIYAQADWMTTTDRHSWAMAHVYKPMEAWV